MTRLPRLATTEERFWQKVDRRGPDECWPWLGSIDSEGYGYWHKTGAYRQAYLFSVGPIPAGLTIDHLCRNRRCVNPLHLEPVTHAENMRRSRGFRVQRHCQRGHELPTYVPGAYRRCDPCARIGHTEYMRGYRARKRAAA